MARVAVVGTAGRLGRRLVRAITDRGHAVAGFARSGDGPSEHLASVPPPVAPEGWDEVVGSVDVVVSTRGPWHPDARSIVSAARRAGRPYVDPIHSVGWAREVDRGADGPPVSTGVGVVGALGALLARVGATELDDVVSVEVTHLAPLAATRGARAALVHTLAEPTRVISGGSVVAEPTGHIHRPAYLPHPLGPRRAVSFPSAEPLLVQRWLPAIRSVRAYTVLAGWMVGLLPLTTALARRGRLPSTLLLGATPREHGWGVLAEASDGERTARAWAVGVDAYAATAHLVARWVEGALGGEDGWASSVASSDVLDDLARRGGSRWAVRPPSEDVGG